MRALGIVAVIAAAGGWLSCSGPVAEHSEPFKHRPPDPPPPPPGSEEPAAGPCTTSAEPPASCWDWKVLEGRTDDGCYTVDPDGALGPLAAFDVYCHQMGGYLPKEYITLAHPETNYSVFAGGGSCPCADWVVRYRKLRLELQTMSIVTADRTFADGGDLACVGLEADCHGAFALTWAQAGSCAGPSDTSGEAELDLGGTGFAVAGAAVFQATGLSADGGLTWRSGRASALLSGGGACGAFGGGARVPVTRL